MQVKMNEDEEKWKDSLKKIDELESSEKNHLSTIAVSENEVKEVPVIIFTVIFISSTLEALPLFLSLTRNISFVAVTSQTRL